MPARALGGPTGSSARRSSVSRRSSRPTARSPHAVGVDSGTVGARAGAAGLGRRPGRRGHHRRQHVHRHGARDLACRRDARSSSTSTRRRTRSTRRRSRRRSRRARRRSFPVHLYGQPADMDAICRLAGARGLFVIEDACQAHGARYKGTRAGSLGHAAAFSFYPAKNLGALRRRRRVVTTDDARCATRVRMLRNYGQREKYRPRRHRLQPAPRHAPGGHPAGQAAPPRRVERTAPRHADLYGALLGERRRPDRAVRRKSSRLAPVRRRRRTTATRSCRARAQRDRDGHPLPHPGPSPAGVRRARARPGRLPGHRAPAGELLSLPMYPELTRELVEHVAAAVREHAGRAAQPPGARGRWREDVSPLQQHTALPEFPRAPDVGRVRAPVLVGGVAGLLAALVAGGARSPRAVLPLPAPVLLVSAMAVAGRDPRLFLLGLAAARHPVAGPRHHQAIATTSTASRPRRWALGDDHRAGRAVPGVGGALLVSRDGALAAADRRRRVPLLFLRSGAVAPWRAGPDGRRLRDRDVRAGPAAARVPREHRPEPREVRLVVVTLLVGLCLESPSRCSCTRAARTCTRTQPWRPRAVALSRPSGRLAAPSGRPTRPALLRVHGAARGRVFMGSVPRGCNAWLSRAVSSG